jgi:hypothetical protein
LVDLENETFEKPVVILLGKAILRVVVLSMNRMAHHRAIATERPGRLGQVRLKSPHQSVRALRSDTPA